MNLENATVVRLLSDLKRKDRKHRVFGSAAHRYDLNSPLPSSVIDEFEARYGITIPDDYRCFVTEIGNGGAGPYYGLFPFGHDDDGLWEESGLIGDVSQPFSHVAAWNLPKSFWEQEPDIPPGLPADEEQRLWDAWDNVEQEQYWNPAIMNGAIPICHMGCALRQWLIVNGEQKGFVWNDYRADGRGILPVVDELGGQQTFSGWYMSWLEEGVEKVRWGGV